SFQLIGIVINGLPLNLIISSRLEQLIYVVFCLIPSIQLRFSFLTLKRPLPKITPIIDLISIILSMLALTPFAFMGYFEFPWGRFSASGPVVQTFGIVGLITIFIVLREWWKFKNKDNPLGNYTAIFIGVGGLMLFGNIPATMGIEFYPIGNISIFSTMILAYAVMKFGGNTIKTEALRLSYRLTPFAIFGTLLFLIFFWKFIYTKENLSESILHLLLIGLPMILLGFLFTFLLIQPIASRIDNTIDNLANAKKTTDEVKKEIEKLNEFTNLINSTSDISIIFKEIYSFLNHSMGFEHTWTLLVDKETNELYSYKSTIISSKEDKLDKDFFQSFRKKLEPSLGTLYQTYVKKVPLYIRDIHTSMEGTKNKNINIWNGEVYTGTKTDLLIIIKGKLSSISQFPLILNNEVIGILCISVFGRKLEMSREELEKVKRFSNQIVGVINNAQLLSLTARAKEEAEIEKEKALLAKKETENQKHETEELNLLIKSLNEKLDLKVIMKKVHRYVKENFGINDYGLYTVNPDKTYLKLIQSHFPVFLNEEDRETIINFQMPILGQKGAHSLAFQRKRPFYFPNVMHPRTANLITEEERFV
ncbi:MAG: hypothetical protein KDK36_03085, partial [Leptospiraceae bacterium]|nr:hypothetical protein [Leptospiraceae bacterium]